MNHKNAIVRHDWRELILPLDENAVRILSQLWSSQCSQCRGTPMKTEHTLSDIDMRDIWQAALTIAPDALYPDTSFKEVVKDVKAAFIFLRSTSDCEQCSNES